MEKVYQDGGQKQHRPGNQQQEPQGRGRLRSARDHIDQPEGEPARGENAERGAGGAVTGQIGQDARQELEQAQAQHRADLLRLSGRRRSKQARHDISYPAEQEKERAGPQPAGTDHRAHPLDEAEREEDEQQAQSDEVGDLNPAVGLAEVAYMVDPGWQGSGLGRILHAGLVEYGRAHGARGLTADVLSGNTRMMRVFEGGDHSLAVKTQGGVEELTMVF